jgi:hypothetical protein
MEYIDHFQRMLNHLQNYFIQFNDTTIHKIRYIWPYLIKFKFDDNN